MLTKIMCISFKHNKAYVYHVMLYHLLDKIFVSYVIYCQQNYFVLQTNYYHVLYFDILQHVIKTW